MLVLLCSSCAKFDEINLPVIGSKYFEHIVNSEEENLYNITTWRTGGLERYNDIREVNPSLSPYNLKVGDKVLIPKEFVTNSEVMPKPVKKVKKEEMGKKDASNTQIPSEKYFSHKVRLRGESLSIIAKWYSGKLENWKILASANPNLNPNRIDIGDEILIPESIMLRKDQITQEFIEDHLPKKKKIQEVTEVEPEVSDPPPDSKKKAKEIIEGAEIELVPPKF